MPPSTWPFHLIFQARPSAMKKLLGGIFARSPSAESPRAASTPPAVDADAAGSTSKRWGAFLMPSAPPPVATADQVRLLIVEGFTGASIVYTAFDVDVWHTRLSVDESCFSTGDPTLEQLKGYFASPVGVRFCEQTAFPSLVLDFVAKMRIFAMKEELKSMIKREDKQRTSDAHQQAANIVDEPARPALEQHTVIFTSLIPFLGCLMNCVVAIASNETLMEMYRCELPNLVALTAEEYPPSALFIRDGCSRAILSVPEHNFNAALAWYLLDCNVVGKTITLITNYTLATTTTSDTAQQALQQYMSAVSIYGASEEGINDSAAAAAVSEALGLTRSSASKSDPTLPTGGLPLAEEVPNDREPEIPNSNDTFCLQCYDVRVGFRSINYILERTNRFTLVLLDEFYSTGGYTLLLRLLDTCVETDIPALLNVLTLLIPLGARQVEASDGVGMTVGASVLIARNVHAFAAMRDLLLKYVREPEQISDGNLDVNTAMQSRDEHLVLQLLIQILHIYTSDYDNFVFLEPKTRTLALLLTKLPFTTFYDAQVIILRIVEYVCCAAKPDDPLPHEVLSIICGLLIAYSPLSSRPHLDKLNFTDGGNCISDLSPTAITPDSMLVAFDDAPSSTLSTLMCECLIKILRDCDVDRYKHELSGFGLMERGIYPWLDQIATCLSAVPVADLPTSHKFLTTLKHNLDIYSRMLHMMLQHNTSECVRFRESHVHQSLYVIIEIMLLGDVLSSPFDLVVEIPSSENELPLLFTFAQLAGMLRRTENTSDTEASLLQSGVESDLNFILQLLQRFRGAIWRQQLLLRALIKILQAGRQTVSPLWKDSQGYEILVALFSSVDFASSDSHAHAFAMMDLIFQVLSVTLGSHGGNDYNAEYFKSICGYSTVASCIVTSGALDSSKREDVINRIFNIICGGPSHIEIYNGDAVQIMFRLLPILPVNDATATVAKLLSMLESIDGAATISKAEQAVRVVCAGAFQWICDPKIVSKLMDAADPLQPLLVRWIVAIALPTDLTIPRVHDFLRLVGKTMPRLLSTGRNLPESISEQITPESGLLLLQEVLRYPGIRHISVGKPHGAGLTGQYVHIVNSTDRIWPPSSGYSFFCWLRFPSLADNNNKSHSDSTLVRSTNQVNCAAPATLCEGHLCVTRCAENAGTMEVYGVLVDTTFKLFSSSKHAHQNEEPLEVLSVTSIFQKGPLELAFWSNDRAFEAKCSDGDAVKMWFQALQSSVSLNTGLNSDMSGAPSSKESMMRSFVFSKDLNVDGTAQTSDFPGEPVEGSACIVSVYSLDSSGCFVRVFFEQSTGFLRFHTGAVSSGPSMNPNPKRTSVIFETVSIDELRPDISSKSSGVRVGSNSGSISSSHSEPERKRDWHHFAFTHRKAVVGSSLVTVYVDGQEVATRKLTYPSAPSAGSFQAFVGSDAQVCSPQSALSWKVGSAWLTDEVVPSGTIAGIFSLGPTFTHQFSGHSYRSVGDWPEALASSHLARAADRGIEVTQLAQRLQLAKLGKSSRRSWRDLNVIQNGSSDSVAAGAALIAESMIAKKEELAEGLRFATGGGMSSRKEANSVTAYRNFITYDCALSSFGTEIEHFLGNCKLPEDTVLFALNSSCSDRTNTPVLLHTQVHYINCEQSSRFDLSRSLPSVGGMWQIFFPLLDNAQQRCDFYLVLKMLVIVLRRNPSCLAECISSNGYSFICALLCRRVDIIDEQILKTVVRLAVAGKMVPYATSDSQTSPTKLLAHPVIADGTALSQVVLNIELRKKLPHHLQCQLISLLMDLIVMSNPNAIFNARQLRRSGLLQWILTYVSEVGNEDCDMSLTTALEMRWCFPKFVEPTFEAILQYVLSLLREFLRMESHADDVSAIAELVLLSMTANDVINTRTSSTRVIILQFLLHEIEHDAYNGKESNYNANSSAQSLSETIVEAILYCDGATPTLKAKRSEISNHLEPVSPLADRSLKFGKSLSSVYPVDSLANVLLDVIGQDSQNGRWISAEACLAIRVLLSLAQEHLVFAEHLFCHPVLVHKLKSVLTKYSIDCWAFIPLLAYVSNIRIGGTSYYDLDIPSASDQGLRTFVHPSSVSNKLPSTSRCVDRVWDLIGDLLLRNCREIKNTTANEINVIVLEKITFQVKTNRAFAAAVCKSSGTAFRIVIQCLLFLQTKSSQNTTTVDEPENNLHCILQHLLGNLTIRTTAAIKSKSTTDACLEFMRMTMIRALHESDDFGSLMMLFLESLDELISQLGGSVLSRTIGQHCWLALLKRIVDEESILASCITLVSIKNVCTLCVALSRYLADEENHKTATPASNDKDLEDDEIGPQSQDNSLRRMDCFGVEALSFLLWCIEMISQPVITQSLGTDEQLFFYGTLIYCAQTVVLSELGGAHQDKELSQNVLDYLIHAKHVLFQQPRWKGVIVCGILTQSSANDTGVGSGIDSNTASSTSGRPRRMHRIRSLSANSHKEFEIGTESDRSFILSFASQLFRLLMNDLSRVRHAAILLWQALIDLRFDVLKELLIAEPRASLLHTITSTKKEATVDVFHGGFDRLLYVLHTPDAGGSVRTVEVGNTDVSFNQEIWCQFQLWLTENNSLLVDLIVARTETIYKHAVEVLLSCTCLSNTLTGKEAPEIRLDTDFPVRPDIKAVTNLFEQTIDECEHRDIIAKRALIRISSFRDSAVESLNDILLQWKKTSLQLAHTRNIWQTGKWQVDSNDDSEADHELDQRSVFQRRLLGYCLDTTEGPQRMRLRLMQDFSTAQRLIQASTTKTIDAKQVSVVDNQLVSSNGIVHPSGSHAANEAECVDNEPFRRSLEFHEAVEVFRECVYQKEMALNNSGGNSQTLQDILGRCKINSTRNMFSTVDDSAENYKLFELDIVAMAREIYSSFLESAESDSKRGMGVSSSIIADIDRFINEAKEKCDEFSILSTLFDAADAEATQHALCAMQLAGTQAIVLTTSIVPENPSEVELEQSDDEAEDEAPNSSVSRVDGVESDDSDSPSENTINGVLPISEDRLVLGKGNPSREPTSSKSEISNVSRRVDTSCDAVYGAIARFLQSEDYPPIKSYNATYIAGMSRARGIFVICRLGLYFIGGYSKRYASVADDISKKEKAINTQPVVECEVSEDASISSHSLKATMTPTGARRKTTKTMIRAALNDLSIQFAQSKVGTESFFAVVPVVENCAEPGKPTTPVSLPSSPKTLNSRWSIKYSNVKQFCRIKYQLRPVGIEFSDLFGSTYFLQLDTSADREEIVKLLFQLPLVNSIFWNPVFRTGAMMPSIKKICQTATKRWLRGCISNFEYLIHLNTLAGRSFNDITQYPVFPWVIADYTSPFLDLDAADTYRDLSKPMGAIGESRSIQFCERYAAMNQDADIDGPMGTPAFHYGTHYSCSAYVINYLIRLEPYTALALELQGGVFDHPDRLFRCVPSSWASASRENLQDVRELIPEFFYLPEFLYNANECKFGTTQSGEEVCHVVLPPWAHGDPREFVRLNRRALESKYVSEHLHEWIDLVFGAKQTGQAAVEAQNVFMHFTYEGTVDIEKITDPVMRAATLAQIENFGQTPSRLFSSPHPQRKVPTLLPTQLGGAPATEVSLAAMNSSAGHQYDGITPSTIEAYVKWHTPLAPALVSIGKEYVFLRKHSALYGQVNGCSIGDIKLIHDKMHCQSVGCIFVPPRFAKYLDWGNNKGVMKLRVHQQSSSAGRYREANKVIAIIEGAHQNDVNCASMSGDGGLLVTGGQDSVVNLIECSKASDGRRIFKQVAKFVGHTDAVVCVAINKVHIMFCSERVRLSLSLLTHNFHLHPCQEFNLIASSSADRSVLLWDLRTRALLHELGGHSTTVAHVSINGATGNVLTGTNTEIRLWSINGDLLAASPSSTFGLQTIVSVQW
ncbi:unnamed protein product [Phytophthora lilii]|uniref:Unnamed protein product n=1 Tax=Phytophthora lilii TaxID=2077276 RepID=A0A9W6X3K2_9STRA|nr:unnamed protein product [Phytophthora lilii]